MKHNKIISSLLYKAVESLGTKGFGLLVGILLARMLTPRAFGQIAIMTVFINLSIIMNQSGLNTALVQKKHPTETDYSTVFYITVTFATVFFGLIYVAAPWISRYYEEPTLTLPLRVYAFSLFFYAFNSVQVAKLQKEMRFKTLMNCSLTATVLSGTLGIVLAYCNAGLWALVIYHMSNTLFVSIAILFVERWRPRLQFSRESAKQLYSYGWKIFAAAMACSITEELRSLIIGKRFSADALGLYDRGRQFPHVISSTMTHSVQGVMLPAMSEVQDETLGLRRMLKRTVSVGSFLVMPAMFGLAAVARPVVEVLLSEKWLPSVFYMQVLSIAEALIHVTFSNLTVIKASGRSDVFMKLEFARRALFVSVLCISVFGFRSVEVIAIGYCIGTWLDCCLIVLTVKWLLHVPFCEQLSWVWKSLLSSVVMFVLLLLMCQLQMPSILLLLLQISTGVAVHVGMSILLKNETLITLWNMLFRKKH